MLETALQFLSDHNEIAIATVKEWLSSHPASSIKQVVFKVFKDKDHDIYQRLLAEG